jgi:hypothetical protein
MTWLTRRRIGALVAIAFIVGVIEFLPAYHFEERINRALPAPWHASMSGTIWNGFGVLQTGQTADALTIPLTWKFDAMALTRLRVGWKVVPTSPALTGSFKVGMGLRSVEFGDAAVTMDAGSLQQAIPTLALLAPSGTLQISTPNDTRLELGYGNDLRLSGGGHINAESLGLARFSPQPLGNYELSFTARDAAINYVIVQSSGALKLDGGGSIQTVSPGQIAYVGHITASPALPENLLAQLKSIGQPMADGRLRVDWKARWQ